MGQKRTGYVAYGIDRSDIWDVVKNAQKVCRQFPISDQKEFPDDIAGIEVTIGFDENGYADQLGDNSYSGPAYSCKNWAVTFVPRNGSLGSCVDDLEDQILDRAAYDRDFNDIEA